MQLPVEAGGAQGIEERTAGRVALCSFGMQQQRQQKERRLPQN